MSIFGRDRWQNFVVGRDVCVCVCVCENDIFEVFKFFYIFLWLLVGVYIELNSDDESFMSC